jgi:hypothetical protein
MGTTAPCPTPQRRPGSGRADAQSWPPLQGRATEWCPTPFPSWHSARHPAAKSAPSCCTSIQMASRLLATSATRFPLAAAVSPSKKCASCPWPAPMRWPASCRALPAPRCRCSEASGPWPAGASRPVSERRTYHSAEE